MIRYKAHVQNVGWTDFKTDGETAGTVGLALRLEALIVESDYNLKYKAHVQNVGWQDWVKRGEAAGTVGLALRMEAFRIELIDPPKTKHIWYRVHVENAGWTEWAIDGTIVGSVGQGLRMEAVEIKIVDDNNVVFAKWTDDMKKCKIGDVIFSTTTGENATLTCDITDKAIEGGNVADHGDFKPLSMSISGIIIGDDAQEKKEKIQKYMMDVEVLRYIGIETANNVCITNFTITRNSSISNGFDFTMTLKEIRIATGIVTVINEKNIYTQQNNLKNGGLQAVLRE